MTVVAVFAVVAALAVGVYFSQKIKDWLHAKEREVGAQIKDKVEGK